MSATDPALDRLTDEQVVAAGTPHPLVYIEARPGSGKTTVAAQRYGALRYARGQQIPGRGVTAVSFTRSATAELRDRVVSSWGPTAIAGANRIVTLDTLITDLFHDLLIGGLIRWPRGHTELEVLDTWKVRLEYFNMTFVSGLTLVGTVVQPQHRRMRTRTMNPTPSHFERAVAEGVCTHDDVRHVFELAAKLPGVVGRVRERLTQTVSALVVDEIFDANRLDLAVVRLAANAGLPVTVVGDPWQALYGFRGAQPDLVPAVIKQVGMATLPLSHSFRWRTGEQRKLAGRLRSSHPVVLPSATAQNIDVVLARTWNDLWAVGSDVLPLAFKPQPGNTQQATATLLLNVLTQTRFGQPATYLVDAMITLGIQDQKALGRLDAGLNDLLQRLAELGPAAARNLWPELVATVKSEAPRYIKSDPHKNYYSRLAEIADRARRPTLVPGLTVHQAKGREWSTVGVRLKDDDIKRLATGLTAGAEVERQICVALTRARSRTVRV